MMTDKHKCCGGKSKTGCGSEEKQASQSFPNSVAGSWVSDWGPVTFSEDEGGTLSGSWEEGENKIGKIHRGKFDPATGSFNFDFCETWTGLEGKAVLKLSSDHRELSGAWTRGEDKGEWTMQRPDNMKTLAGK